MGKKKENKVEEVERFELPGGATLAKMSDGSFVIYPAPIVLTTADAAALLGDGETEEAEEAEEEVSIEDMKEALLESGEYTKKDLKKMSDEEIEEAYGELETEETEEETEEEAEEEVSIEDMKEALLESGEFTKKDLKKMSDEEIEEAYGELETEGTEEEADDDDDEDGEEADDEDEDVTGEDLAEMDFEELEDLCDSKDLDVDPDDYDEDSVEKLRKEVAKALGITLPKKGKK